MSMTVADGSVLRSLGLTLERDEAHVARPVSVEVVSICAWCDTDKIQTRALLAQGKRVSHTCCQFHMQQQIERARFLNLKKAA